MAVTNTPVYVQAPQLWACALLNSTGAFTFAANSNVVTNLVSVLAAGTNGSKIEAINVSTTDTSPNTLQLLVLQASVLYVLTTVSIPAQSGFTTSAPSVNILANAQFPGLSYDSQGNKYFYMPSGTTLYAGTTSIVTSAKQVSVVAIGGNF